MENPMTPETFQTMLDSDGAYVVGVSPAGTLFSGPALDVKVFPDGFWFAEPGAEFGHQVHNIRGEVKWHGNVMEVERSGQTFNLYLLTDGTDGDAELAAKYRAERKQYLATMPTEGLQWLAEQKKLATQSQ